MTTAPRPTAQSRGVLSWGSLALPRLGSRWFGAHLGHGPGGGGVQAHKKSAPSGNHFQPGFKVPICRAAHWEIWKLQRTDRRYALSPPRFLPVLHTEGQKKQSEKKAALVRY